MMIHFIRPYWLLALLPLSGLLWQMIKRQRSASAWKAVCDPKLLPHILVNTGTVAGRWPLILLGLSWLLTVLALAGPAASHLSEPVYGTEASRVVVLDLSSSMNATDLKPNRAMRAQYKILDILKRSREGQVGLIAFSAEPYVASPLTQDAATIAAMVPELTPKIMPVQGAKLETALEKADQLFKQADIKRGDILVMTDSPVTASDVQIAKQLRDEGITTSVLAMGTEQAVPLADEEGNVETNAAGGVSMTRLDINSLQQLASAGGGRYQLFTSTDDDLDHLLASSSEEHLHAKKTDQVATIWQDEGRWLIFPVLVFASLAFRRGGLARVIDA